jgi:hypothetical protein
LIKVTSAIRVANFSAQEARDELRTMAQSLVDAKGNVKSGYIKLLDGGDGEKFGTRWTRESTGSTQRALKRIEALISKACEGKQDIGIALQQSLSAYVAKKGDRLGTQSFVKMVQVLDRLDAPERGLDTQVFNAKLKSDLTLQTQDVEQKVLQVPSIRMVVLTPEESQQAIEGLGDGLDKEKMLGSGRDPTQCIKDEGMLPAVKFSLANGSIFLSKVKAKNGRLHAQAIISLDDGRKSSVTAYQSKSQGVWRLTGYPASGGYDKGPGEQFMTLDSEIQKYLHSQEPEGEINKPLIWLCLVDYPDQEKYVEKSQKALVPSTLEPLKVAGTYSEGEVMALTPPEAIMINESLKPNFDKLVDFYQADLPMHGRAKFYVYGSADKSCEYIIGQGQDGKAWVAHAGPKDPAYSSSGFPKQGLDFGDLISPRWEYSHQIAAVFGASAEPNSGQFPGYASNWSYVKQIPLIRDWYQSRGLTVQS